MNESQGIFWLHGGSTIHKSLLTYTAYISVFLNSVSVLMLLAKTFITTPLYSYFFKMHDCMTSMTGDMVTIAYFIVVVCSKLILDMISICYI